MRVTVGVAIGVHRGAGLPASMSTPGADLKSCGAARLMLKSIGDGVSTTHAGIVPRWSSGACRTVGDRSAHRERAGLRLAFAGRCWPGLFGSERAHIPWVLGRTYRQQVAIAPVVVFLTVPGRYAADLTATSPSVSACESPTQRIPFLLCAVDSRLWARHHPLSPPGCLVVLTDECSAECCMWRVSRFSPAEQCARCVSVYGI